MIGANGEQARILALSARVRLETHGVVSRNFTQLGAEIFGEFSVTLSLIRRCKGVYVGKFRPGNGQHLCGGVELHGAGAQRNHRPI